MAGSARRVSAGTDLHRVSVPSAEKYLFAMLVPLVMLILPVTVAFAVFPGVMVLQLGF